MTFLIIALVLLVLLGGFRFTPYGSNYRGYSDSGIGAILVILFVLYLLGVLR